MFAIKKNFKKKKNVASNKFWIQTKQRVKFFFYAEAIYQHEKQKNQKEKKKKNFIILLTKTQRKKIIILFHNHLYIPRLIIEIKLFYVYYDYLKGMITLKDKSSIGTSTIFFFV